MKEGLCEGNQVIATNNPAEGRKPRTRVLSDAELRSIWNACGDDDPGHIVKLLLLTGCRRDEIGVLSWSEIDGGTMTISGERTKNHLDHALTLPPVALALLPALRTTRPYVFANHGRGFQNWGYAKIALDNRIAAAAGKPLAPWVLHDLRRTMRTGLGKIGVPPHVAELVINHVKGGVEGIYDFP